MTQSRDVTPIPTGLHELDRLLGGGLHRSDFIVLASVTSMGKTSLALSIAHHIVQNTNYGVAYITLQMTLKEITEWVMSIESELNLDHSLFVYLTDEDRVKLNAARQTFIGKKLWAIDETRLTTEKIQQLIENVPEQHKPDLIIIDDLRLMSVLQRKAETLQQEVSCVAGELKMLAKALTIPILALVSVSTSIIERESPLPTLQDLREIGAIDTFCDVVLFLHRDEAFNEETGRRGLADVFVAKNHHGALGQITCEVAITHHRFRNLGE